MSEIRQYFFLFSYATLHGDGFVPRVWIKSCQF